MKLSRYHSELKKLVKDMIDTTAFAREDRRELVNRTLGFSFNAPDIRYMSYLSISAVSMLAFQKFLRYQNLESTMSFFGLIPVVYYQVKLLNSTNYSRTIRRKIKKTAQNQRALRENREHPHDLNTYNPENLVRQF